MKKAHLLASAARIAHPPVLPNARREKGEKPVAVIGTMRRDATADQRRQHHKLTMKMKADARELRYQASLQDKANSDS